MDFADFLRWEETSHDVIKVKRIYIDVAGDMIAGILLSQIVYWYLPSKSGQSKLRVKKDGSLWLAKGREDWWEECRISPWQFDRAVALLAEKGVIEKKRFRFEGSPTVCVRLLPEALMEAINSLLKYGGVAKLDFSETRKSNLVKHEIPFERNTKNITETTTEITTETTKSTPPSGRFARAEYSADFSLFWNSYPRQHAKQEAWRVWQARLRNENHPATAQELQQAAAHYRSVCESTNTPKHFIMHAATFLGPSLRYLDYLDPSCIEEAKKSVADNRRRSQGYTYYHDDDPERSKESADFWTRIAKYSDDPDDSD